MNDTEATTLPSPGVTRPENVWATSGPVIPDESNANPAEATSLRRSRKQAQAGDVRWVAEDESLSDAIDSASRRKRR